jgi:hypothetical protein
MTDVPPSQPVIVMPSQGTVAGVATSAIDALRTSPVLLLIVVLNMTFALAAGYYLLQQESYRAKDRDALAGLLEKCITQTVPISYLTKEDRK